MGPKRKEKDKSKNSPKPSQPPSQPPPPQQPPREDGEWVKSECEKALNSLRRGNHTKALRLMKEITAKHPDSPLVNRVHGTISLKAAAIIDDPTAKNRHLKNAVGFARKAVALSPNSVEFALFYANLLYDAATEGKDYEAVVAECERALGIESPTDPMRENVLFVGEEGESGEARVLQVQQELKGLIQKANIASISTWMKNLGGGSGGEDRIRLIPLRTRAAEDMLESRFLNGGGGGVRRSNEIKKASKTAEERRMEIEVRVAAAKLLQRQKESEERSGGSGGGGGGEESGGRGGSGGGTGVAGRGGERRRFGGSGRRHSSISERKDQVRVLRV